MYEIKTIIKNKHKMLFYFVRNYKMFKLVFHLFLIKLSMTSDSGDDILEALNLIPPLRTPKKEVEPIDGVCYSPLRNYHRNATAVAPSKYPWIADVVHSRSADVPHVCTAACIEDGIFVTAAACIYSLKIKYTTLLYMSSRLVVRAFVLPSVPTKQMYDDIGIIVVDVKKAKGVKWVRINLFTAVKRTDEKFKWFANLDKSYGKINYRVIGYALEQGRIRFPKPEERFNLFELDVIVDQEICFKLLKLNNAARHESYRVPCYHTCPYKIYYTFKEACHNRFLGVEGGAVIDTISNKLIGVATWGGGELRTTELPVGFSFANSETFYKDLACAKWIRDDNGQLDKKGYYQSLCDGKQ